MIETLGGRGRTTSGGREAERAECMDFSLNHFLHPDVKGGGHVMREKTVLGRRLNKVNDPRGSLVI